MTNSWKAEYQGWYFIMKNIKREWKRFFFVQREKSMSRLNQTLNITVWKCKNAHSLQYLHGRKYWTGKEIRLICQWVRPGKGHVLSRNMFMFFEVESSGIYRETWRLVLVTDRCLGPEARKICLQIKWESNKNLLHMCLVWCDWVSVVPVHL